MTEKQPSLLVSLIPIAFLVGLLVVNVQLYGDDTLGGSNQMALLFSGALASILAISIGQSWKSIFDGVTGSIASALPAIIILLLIGALAGTWMISGIVPAMIYYGLEVLNPSIFLVASCLVCIVVSLATGSSWTTVATVGIALMGIGQVLGVGEGMVAGAIISGAYFGDKMSPLSDTTNLAPAMAGTDLITHIRHMAWTTIPSISIALIVFLIIGFTVIEGGEVSGVEELQMAISSKFNISPWLFLVPLAVIGMIVKRIPAVPALMGGSVLGGIFAIIFQPEIVADVAGQGGLSGSYMAVINAMTSDISIVTENEMVNDLLNTSGMYGMLNTIWLIVCAMMFGGAMEASGMLKRITQSLMVLARSTGSLIATTTGTCLVLNATASDQYLAIVVPGRMFASEYRDRGLAPENLSRTLEDTGTVTSALIPWNTCGAYHSGVLGVATGDYFMYAFFNLISPLMTMLFGFMGWKINPLKEEDSE